MMRRSRRQNHQEEANPYIAFADVCVCLVLILVVLLAMGQIGQADDRYLKAQREFEAAVSAMPAELRPEKLDRNDPPGSQRWAYLDRSLFTASNDLSPIGQQVLGQFARLLKDHKGWKRVRIEGHAMPSPLGKADNWASSAAVAAVTAELFQEKANIKPWMLAVAGRGGQTPYYKVFLEGADSPEGKQIARRFDSQGVRYSVVEPSVKTEVTIAKNLRKRSPDKFDLDAYRRNQRIEIVVEFLSSLAE